MNTTAQNLSRNCRNFVKCSEFTLFLQLKRTDVRIDNLSVKKMQKVLEIADFLMANPSVTKQPKVKEFAKKFRHCERVIWEYFSIADEYVKSLLQKQEDTKQEIYRKAMEVANKNILSFIDGMEIMTTIARGNARLINVKGVQQLVIPSDSERIRAVQLIFNIRGFMNKGNTSAKSGDPEGLTINVLDEATCEEVRKLVSQPV